MMMQNSCLARGKKVFMPENLENKVNGFVGYIKRRQLLSMLDDFRDLVKVEKMYSFIIK